LNRFRCLAIAAIVLVHSACSTSSTPAGYRIAVVPSRTGQHGIFVMNSDTTGGKLLTADAMAQLRPNSWCPDGSRIAFFSTRKEDSGMMQRYPLPQHFPLYVMGAGGGDQNRLLKFPVTSFSWSPDGHKLFIVSGYENPVRFDPGVTSSTKPVECAGYEVDLESGEQKRLTAFGLNMSGTWSPDGNRLALSLGDGPDSDLYVMKNLDAAHTRRLTQGQTVDVRPLWAPVGNTIAYVSLPAAGIAKGADNGVFMIDADTAQKRKVTDLDVYGMSWSPDGKTLLLQVAGAIYLARAEGGAPVKLQAPTDSMLDAVFTPDGKRVMFRSNYEGDWNLYTIDLGDRKCRRVTEQLTAFSFALSPVGR
jgi:Tol biopolymer transport system component